MEGYTKITQLLHLHMFRISSLCSETEHVKPVKNLGGLAVKLHGCDNTIL